jgi:hypothetical protein
MYFPCKKYTTLHPDSGIKYELHQINHFVFAQSNPSRMGFGSGLDLYG